MSQLHWKQAHPIGYAMMALALLWYGALQARWFALKLEIGLPRAWWIASLGMFECVVAILLLVPLLF